MSSGEMVTRQRFITDNDGHWYLIDVGQEREFEHWVEAMGSSSADEWKGWDFEDNRIDSSPEYYTILDAKRIS